LTTNKNSKQYLNGVIWITGLSGSGKTSLANKLRTIYLENGLNAIQLDGDELRGVLGTGDSYDRDSRLSIGKIYARLARLLASQGNIVIVSAIALFHEVHLYNRQFSNFCEIYLSADQKQLAEDDRKSIYARKGTPKQNVVGVDLEPEFPKSPHRMIPNCPDSLSEIDIDELYSLTVSFMSKD
jgi:cytidine diphosphoramidate kinase